MYSGYVTMAYFWAMMAQKANEKIAEKPENIDFYQAKVRTAEFYFERIFPQNQGAWQNHDDRSTITDADYK